ncbi:DUF751 family protein [Merismopedia glauca]|uniref:DUF751 domain-containing protein n=1 Tax=Merismopedia glauca CCAP 1448/3 TaxID=1296344 RepID=A0A2T1CAE4_9CYAN|nr:DUF751 family protein [Merismopedia glauca]PSB05240.1 DUF751 domain-containing protein [Merismopedia glauca CCAP 1448/3]
MNEFFNNISRYPRFLITISLGIFFALFGWLKPLLERPVTAIALIGLVLASFSFVFLTLRAMLGTGVSPV